MCTVYCVTCIVGVGTALVYTPTVSVLGQYFEKRRALANGIGAAGAGVGAFLVPPLVTVILDEYTLSGTLLIMGGLMLNLVVCGALLRPLEFYTKPRTTQPQPKAVPYTEGEHKHLEAIEMKDLPKQQPNHDEIEFLAEIDIEPPPNDHTKSESGKSGRTFDWSVIKTPLVLTYGISLLFVYSGLPVVLMFLPAFGISVGLSDQDASLLLSLQGAGDLAGRILFGYLADLNLTHKQNFYIVGGVVSGVAAGLMPYVGGGFPALATLCFVYGTGIGNVFGLLPVLVAEGLGPRLLPSGYAFITVAMGIPFLYAPALGGK